METARTLGFRDTVAMTQFNLLAHFIALLGKQPEHLQQDNWDGGRRLLLEAARRIPNRGVKALSTALFNLEATLFHCELIDQLPRRRSADAPRTAPTSGPGSGAVSRLGWRTPCSTICSRSPGRCGRAP